MSLCLEEYGVIRHQGRLCVLNVDGLREMVIEEAHVSQYSIHPDATKIYRDLWETYWWNGMKRDIADFFAKCPNYQQVKAEHQRSGVLSQKTYSPSCKWEDINMHFIVVFPSTQRQHNSIWVIVDRLTKSLIFFFS